MRPWGFSEGLTLQTSHVPDFRRDPAGEVVDVEVQVGELGEFGDLRRDLPRQRVVVEEEAGEEAKPRYRRRYVANQALPLQRDVRHLAELVAADALEAPSSAGFPFRRPRREHPPLRVQRILELHQRPHLRIPLARSGGERREERRQQQQQKQRHRPTHHRLPPPPLSLPLSLSLYMGLALSLSLSLLLRRFVA